MKIGIIGPIWLNIPPNAYGGTEDVVYKLVNGLTDAGHEVTLFGPATSQVNASVFPTVELPLREKDIPWTDILYHLKHLTTVFDQAEKFDILHMHINKPQDYLAFPLALHSKTPVLFTIHSQLPTVEDHPERYILFDKYRNFPFTSISNSQRKRMPQLNFIKTVYNALVLKDYPFSSETEDYFVWLGMINPRKGTKDAILAAKKAKKKLYVLGVVDKKDPERLAYYEQEIKPLFDYKYIHWLGPANLERKVQYLSRAKAFLNPIQWEEPYGLVMAESQAVGTPVISYNRGAATELVIDGKTGFLVNSMEEMITKMKEVEQLDRRACREHIKTMFTLEKNIEGYLDSYKTTIANWPHYLSQVARDVQKTT